MKSLRLTLSALVLLSLSTVAFAQAAAPKSPSDAQKSFDQLKTLAGSWEGMVKTDPPTPEVDGKLVQVTFASDFHGKRDHA